MTDTVSTESEIGV